MKWHRLVGTTTVPQGLEQRWPHLLSHIPVFQMPPDPHWLSAACLNPYPSPGLVGLGPKYLELVPQVRQQDAAGPNKQTEPVLLQKNRHMNTKEDKSAKILAEVKLGAIRGWRMATFSMIL